MSRLDPNTIPAAVREWWVAQLQRPVGETPFGRLLAQARQHWPDRDCGRDGVVVMYGVINPPTLKVAA